MAGPSILSNTDVELYVRRSASGGDKTLRADEVNSEKFADKEKYVAFMTSTRYMLPWREYAELV
jgi:hypothetical protein